MGRLALKYGSILNLLLMEAWFCSVFFKTGVISPEPLVIFTTTLAAFIYLEYRDQKKTDSTDKKLFHELLNTLPYEGSIAYVDSHDMASVPFDLAEHDDLRNFYNHWDNASHEFLDRKIEMRRKYLYDLIEQYIMALESNTVPVEDGKYTVPPEWETEHAERYRTVINNFHNLAGQIVNAHQELVRFGRKKLRI